MPPRPFFLALLLASLLPAADARACNVPVFRYALERWKPSPYEALVFHAGEPPADARRLIDRLRRPATPANLTVTAVDLSGDIEPGFKTIWERQGAKKKAPWLVLRHPEADDADPDAWSGPLTDAAVAALLDSPARREVVKRLARGDSAVWLLLESGDAKADATARAVLGYELPRLQGARLLPEQAPEPDDLLLDLPLKVVFSSLSVSRADPAEWAFVQALLRSEEGLEKVRGPIVFPVFGRGRALGGLHGKRLTAARLEAEARFLCGPCSCRVKELNEGVDLLLTADWKELLGAAEAELVEREPAAIRPLPLGQGVQEGTLFTVDPGPKPAPDAPRRWPWLAAAGLLAAGAWVWWALAQRGRAGPRG